jgi:hypothetical protein
MTREINIIHSKKITKSHVGPLLTNEVHQIRGISWPLLVANGPLNIIPNEVHTIKLEPFAAVLVSERKEIN